MCLLFAPGLAGAQTPQLNTAEEKKETPSGRALVPFLEGTDVFVTVNKPRETIFEANIAPHLVAFQNFGDVLNVSAQLDRLKDAGVKRLGWAITGTPAVKIRMLKQTSAPVRTPSFMPRVNVQALWAQGVDKYIEYMNSGKTGSPPKPEIDVWEVHGVVGHHSNGQEGCLYQDEKVDPVSKDCVPVEGTPHEINKSTGNFSTNYVKGGFNWRRNRLDKSAVDRNDKELAAVFEFGGGLEVEQHFHTDPRIRDIYGRTRINGVWSIAGRPSGQVDPNTGRIPRNKRQVWYLCDARREAKGLVKYIFGNPDSVKSFALSAELSCFPSTDGGWGLFVRWYYGQDYYNLGFLENINRLHVGATFNQDGFFRFFRKMSD